MSVSVVVETVIKSSENLPKEESNSTSVDSSLRNDWSGRSNINHRERFVLYFGLNHSRAFTDILINEAKVLYVCDVIVSVSIELSKNFSSIGLIYLDVEEREGVRKKDQELFQVEFSL